MHTFKLEHFYRAHPLTPSLEFSTLTNFEERLVVDALLLRARDANGSPAEIMLQLAAQAAALPGVNLEERPIGLRRVFEMCRLNPGPVIYVQWGSLCDIDRFDREDLEKYFYDIWYPGADDIELFDSTYEWLVFVAHFGAVSLWLPTQ